MPRRGSKGPATSPKEAPSASQQQQQEQSRQPARTGATDHEADDSGIQVRPMCLKVHYTFDKDAQVRCLARWPQVLQIRAATLDEQNIIGLIELKTCLQAIAQGSPEIVDQPDIDYTVYAYDYTEPDTPLVGQGILSWNLDGTIESQAPAMLTGRVTKNPLAVFSSGVKETLEVRLKLIAVPKMQRAGDAKTARRPAPTPAETSEWNMFMQSNPALGRAAPVASIPSPAPYPAQAPSPLHFQHSGVPQAQMNLQQAAGPPLGLMPSPRPLAPRRGSLPPPALEPLLSPALEPARFLPREEPPVLPPSAATQPARQRTAKPARSSSRSSSRPRRSTGNPVGRPRRRPLPTSSQNGNTSAAELTDADDGPQKKRVKTTAAEWPSSGPFGSAPESLRVAASTAGSLRTMRPVASTQNPTAASHLQEIPRAPTPIPDGPPAQKPRQAGRQAPAQADQQTGAEQGVHSLSTEHVVQVDNIMQRPDLGQDARSPADSVAVTSPEQNDTPADSPAEVGSSPPVPRSDTYMHSSPPAQSSPVLPPMSRPLPQPDSGFMSGGFDDCLEEDEVAQTLPPASHLPKTVPEAPMLEATVATTEDFSTKTAVHSPMLDLEFCVENPGPPDLLPTTSLFRPHGVVKRLNRVANRPLSRANTEPIPVMPDSGLPSEPQSQALDPLPEFVVPPAPPAEVAKSMDLDMSLDSLPPLELNGVELSKQLEELLRSAEGQASGEDVGSKSLSQAEVIILDDTEPSQEVAPGSAVDRALRNIKMVPASDPVSGLTATALPAFHSDSLALASDGVDLARFNNKNYVKRQTIRERLQEAIERGEMPPYCQNCGAIETPTWRKIWTQDHEGAPQYFEYSEKPGHVTAIEVLTRDDEGKPTTYKLIKKNLGPQDDKTQWAELLLCNPCGIWLAKYKGHRPAERWEKDASRVNQTRRKRDSSHNGGRSKKSRTKSNVQANPTSEAYFTTDPVGPTEEDGGADTPQEQSEMMRAAESCVQNYSQVSSTAEPSNGPIPPARLERMPSLVGSPGSLGIGSKMGSVRSMASGTSRQSGGTGSPAGSENDMGATRRLLFPSPRKDGAPKVLDEVAVNVVHFPHRLVSPKEAMADQENLPALPRFPETPGRCNDVLLDQELFGTPPNRPTTPPSKGSGFSLPFKTPTRATLGQHRPITRSVSRTIKSVKSVTKTPGQLDHLLQTPSRSSSRDNGRPSSMLKKRTPGAIFQPIHAHFALQDELHEAAFESPFTATLQQLLSEANEFTADSSSHGIDLDLTSLPNLDSEIDMHHQLSGAGNSLDFSQFFSTDAVMPSSPPLLRGGSGGSALSSMTLNTGGSATADANKGKEDAAASSQPSQEA